MVAPHLPTVTRLATFSLLLSSVLAQNDTTNSGNNNTTDLNGCPLHLGDFNPNAPINSTGSVNLHWNGLMMDPIRNDWIFTLTYNETRNRNAPNVVFDTMHWLQAYISAPEASGAQVCFHMFGSLNASSASGQGNGCDGVLNDVCTNILRNITFDSGCNLPTPRPAWMDEVREACGDELRTSLLSTSDAIDFSNKTCSIDRPPGSSSPDNYRTWAALGKGITFGNVDSNASDFTWYDTYVRQTIPFVVSVQFAGGIPETQVACVAPKKVVEGGRRPADRSAASLDWRSPSWLVISVAMVVNAASAVVWD